MMLQLRDKIKTLCGELGVKNFVLKWNAFLETKNEAYRGNPDNYTEFTDAPMELYCGEYVCDDEGITTTDRFGGEVIVCRHPILPVARICNIDTGEIKYEVAFKRGGAWKRRVYDAEVLFNNRKVIEMVRHGVAVNSESAGEFTKFMTFLTEENYDKIGETNSVSRLGWVGDYGFSPYVDRLRLDGNSDEEERMFTAIQERGNYAQWLEAIKRVRAADNIVPRLLLAASFGSVLVELCNALPFFVHIWSSTGGGKTVALMMAASVWAKPTLGEYIRTFNTTDVGLEAAAAFCNSMPLCVDELQMGKDRRSFDKIIYELTEGVGRLRGNRSGGMQAQRRWRNCILTNGEAPITNSSSGGGAVNRVIEVDCNGTSLFEDPMALLEAVQQNYGFAGRAFVEFLQDENGRAQAREVYRAFLDTLNLGETTEKQNMAAAVILAADTLAEEWIFQDGKVLKQKDLLPYMMKKTDVEAEKRAWEWLLDFIAGNPQKFEPDEQGRYAGGECWGMVEGDKVYFSRTVFGKKMTENGYNPEAFLSWAARNGLIECQSGRHTKQKRINRLGISMRCVCLNIPQEEETGEELPL